VPEEPVASPVADDNQTKTPESPAEAEKTQDKKPGDEPRTPTPDQEESLDTNTLSVVVLVVMVALVSLALMGRIVVQYVSSMDDNSAQTESIQALIPNSSLVQISSLEVSRQSFSAVLQDTLASQGTNQTEVVLVSEAGREIAPGELFDLLQLTSMPQTMRQSITQVRLLSLQNGEVLMILQFTNRDEVLGGFLNWEESMARELTELYELPGPGGSFSDVRINAVDMRQLVTPAGRGVSYAIIDDNTAIIANDINDIASTANLLETN
jgi:hypothetical protein